MKNCSSDLKENVVKHRGRKPATMRKADAVLNVYLTENQKEILTRYCDENNVKASILVKQLLRAKKIIPLS